MVMVRVFDSFVFYGFERYNTHILTNGLKGYWRFGAIHLVRTYDRFLTPSPLSTYTHMYASRVPPPFDYIKPSI